MSLPTVLYVFPALFCALSWYGAGRLLPGSWLPASPLLAVLSRTAMGAVAFGLATYAIGRAGLYPRALLIVLTAALAVLAVPSLAQAGRIRLRLASMWERALAAVLAVALAVDIVAASAPPTSADALKYHLELPKLWLQAGSIGDAFWSWPSFNPFGIEMLYGQGLALAGPVAANAIGGLLSGLAALAVYGVGRELGRERLAGLAAAALFVLEGVFTWDATSAFVELGMTFYLVLALWYALRYYRYRGGADLAWTGAAAGAAAGTKYVGLESWIIILPFALPALCRARSLRTAAGALSLAVLTGGAWYVKNWIVAGNPVYPVNWGGRWWTAASQQSVDETHAEYGVGGHVVRLAILPVDLLVHGNAFDRGQYVGVGIFVAAAVAIVAYRSRETALLLVGACAYLLAWWYLSAQARFLLPVLAALAALGGAAAARLIREARWRRLMAAGLAALVVDWAVPSVALTRHAFPVAFGATSQAAYLEDETGTHDALVAASRRSRGVLLVAGYPLVFGVPRPAIALGPPEFAADVPRGTFLARLRKENVRYVLDGNRAAASYHQLSGCLIPVAHYAARMVTSRSLGQSEPLDFRLYRLRDTCQS